MDAVHQANYDYLADIQDILLKMDGKFEYRIDISQLIEMVLFCL